MNTRVIKYGSVSGAANSAGSLYSSAENWGDLKKESTEIGALSIGMSALIKLENGSKLSLTSDSQALPTGDFTIYFVMEKNNSGNGNN